MTVSPKLCLLQLAAPFDDVELAYVEWGNPAAERIVVCVHGLTRNARDFDVLAAALAESGARVIAVDVVGRGRSSWLKDPLGYSALTYAAHIGQLCRTLGLARVDWIGTSMGGIVGMIFAATNPTAIGRLILNDVGPSIDQSALAQIAAYVGLDLKFEGIEDVERHFRNIHAGFGSLSDDQWRHMAIHSARQDNDGWRLSYDPAIRVLHAEGAKQDMDLWAMWEKIACPTFRAARAAARAASRPPPPPRQHPPSASCRDRDHLLAAIVALWRWVDAAQIETVRRWLGLMRQE
jgi:pimeloyl-ACP methyl ester carboxylesterase